MIPWDWIPESKPVNDQLIVVAANIVLLFTNRLANELVDLAERELDLNRCKTSDLVELISSARVYMEIGQALLSASETGQKAGNDIRNELEAIRVEVSGLARGARCADDANTEIVDHSKGMRKAVERQNKSLVETTKVISEIMTTIQAMADEASRDVSGVVDRVGSGYRSVARI
jgi:methyl-accepting chemotaxis protein